MTQTIDKPAFTPGPWEWLHSNALFSGDTLVLPVPFGFDLPTPANAYLIAAAPLLYEALKGNDPDTDRLGWLNAVIKDIAEDISAGLYTPEDPSALLEAFGHLRELHDEGRAALAAAWGESS